MNDLSKTASAFVEEAHRTAWASVATVGEGQVPRSRVLHPIWERDSGTGELLGWIATMQTPLKVARLENSRWVSANYWRPEQDACTAECRASWYTDAPTRERIWDLFANRPEPLRYDPSMIPGRESPASPGFMVMRLDPWHAAGAPRSVLLGGQGEVLTWSRRLGELL